MPVSLDTSQYHCVTNQYCPSSHNIASATALASGAMISAGWYLAWKGETTENKITGVATFVLGLIGFMFSMSVLTDPNQKCETISACPTVNLNSGH